MCPCDVQFSTVGDLAAVLSFVSARSPQVRIVRLVLLTLGDSLHGFYHVYVAAYKYDSFFLYMRDSADGLLKLSFSSSSVSGA